MNFKPFNTMEHIIVTPISNGIVRLTPETGYAMFNINTGLNTYSEAAVKEREAVNFYARPKAENLPNE